jgi:Ohr subfamily peroxiredoxin
MSKVLYTAKARVTGGRAEGHGATSDGALEVDLRLPPEMGGQAGGGTNPEQLFAVGFASCFESALGVVARRAKVEVSDVVVDSEVSLTPKDRGFQLGVRLDIALPSVGDEAQAAELVRAAHAVCPYSNATRGNVDVAITVNGQEV